ncbi:MAG: amidohydrolase family protein, partial [Candidatus Cloacimonetes bacterium]|nr:amidohydrolase family protein [Candidatus Cloacimonadota bacterium]
MKNKGIILRNCKIADVKHKTFRNDTNVLIEGNLIKNITQSFMFPDKKEYEIIDVSGRMLLPAFIDTHTHLCELARKRMNVDLNGVYEESYVRERLLSHPDRGKEGKWIQGTGWEFNFLKDKGILNKTYLDKIFPSNPVCFTSKDLHTRWVNSLALKIASITDKTAQPEGGKILKDSDGQPNGILVEKAWDLIIPFIEDIDEKSMLDSIEKTVMEMYQMGLCGVHFMESGKDYEMLCKYKAKGKIRLWWHFPHDLLDEIIARKYDISGDFTGIPIVGMKIFMDGSMGSRTACMFNHYPDQPENFGNLIMSEHALHELILKAAKHKIPSTIHAIGDKCNQTVINAIEMVNSETNYNLRHRIEHLQCVRPEEHSRLRSNNIMCTVQPVHLKSDIEFIEEIWTKTSKYTYNFRSLLNNGVKLAFGSDAPV